MYVALNWLEARLPIVDSWNEKFLHIERGRITKFGAPGMELNQAEDLYFGSKVDFKFVVIDEYAVRYMERYCQQV